MHRQIVTLSNNKRVANFSSPHDFKFVDGTVLGAVSPEVAHRLKVDITEISNTAKKPGDIELIIKMSNEVKTEIDWWIENKKEVDVVFVPLMILTAIKEEFGMEFLRESPFRTIRIEDRVTKEVSIEKQCL